VSKILIFGNSGSGKSTLAKTLSQQRGLSHLDLDTLAWLPTNPPQRMPLAESRAAIDAFISSSDNWVIEGCYTDLLDIAAPHADEVIFMNLPVEACIENARNRPWEPHKYASRAEQDANLEMLIDWISQYPARQDVFSAAAHRTLYETFTGKKRMITGNE
jgi:adenylate kinase family enzyme